MKIRAARALALFAFVALIPAHAVVVNFSATGTFASSGTNIATFAGGTSGSLSIRYAADAPFSQMVTDPVAVRLGRFRGTPTSVVGPVSINDIFTLMINETVPETQSAAFTGVLSGTYTPGSGLGQTASLFFTGTGTRNFEGVQMATVSIGNIVYGVAETVSVNLDKWANVNGFVTPEPATYTLFTAIAGLTFFLARRRRAKLT